MHAGVFRSVDLGKSVERAQPVIPPADTDNFLPPNTQTHIQDWTREEIQAVYDLPFVELLYRAATVRNMHT